ncbi:hypothetical protein GTP46_22280 [Duganella sp. FT135W]|uniref:FlxA-like protein n=1 Tax=Duganella flavida TaxID=2692175 RepID=A0A6L8KEC4_9BURK|nr:hypothetical protein [Duganella flavida]MYM25360.1 hypothetical protein [Duganella flavida]
MNASNVAPAYLAQLAIATGAPGASGATESTTARAAILQQIRKLQKLEAGLGEQLAKLAGDRSSGGIQQRIALQQQIDGIEQQIKALQIALLQKDADRKVTVPKSDGSQTKASGERVSDLAGPENGDKSIAAATTVGTVINTAA